MKLMTTTVRVVAVLVVMVLVVSCESVVLVPEPTATPCAGGDEEAIKCVLEHPEVQSGMRDLSRVLSFQDGLVRDAEDYYDLVQELVLCWNVVWPEMFDYMTPGEVEVWLAMGVGTLHVMASAESEGRSYYEILGHSATVCEEEVWD